MSETELLQLAKDLALELTLLTGQTFQTITDERFVYIKGGGAWLALNTSWRPKDRITVYASTPRAMKGRASNHPEITVSADRTPEQIARDIARRILTEAREYFEDCRTIHRKEKANANALRVMQHRLSPYLKRSHRSHYDTTRTTMHGPRISADLIPTEILELKISHVTLGEAVKIFEILQCRNEPTPEE
ncbi:MAG: hypothetical protein HY869_20875 [Chloroflexi bacterium]|nr:hypothetical protein [Chloroflexota bacterium]